MPRLTSFAVAITAIFTLYMSNAARAEQVTAPGTHYELIAEDTSVYFDHELNDAWLGMPVMGPNGTKIGTVIDASVDEDGFVQDILVGTMVLTDDIEAQERAEAEAIVLSGDRVELRDDYVALQPLDTQLVANNLN